MTLVNKTRKIELKKFILWAIGLAILHVVYIHLVTGITTLEIFSEGNIPYVAWLRSVSFPLAFWTITWHAFREEVVFRLAFLVIPCIKEDEFGLGVAIIGSSVLFGLVHGGFANILLQGVGGLLLCLQFLYFGGAEKDFFKATLATTITHTLVNTILVFVW